MPAAIIFMMMMHLEIIGIVMSHYALVKLLHLILVVIARMTLIFISTMAQ
jgi:hypothetical protein